MSSEDSDLRREARHEKPKFEIPPWEEAAFNELNAERETRAQSGSGAETAARSDSSPFAPTVHADTGAPLLSQHLKDGLIEAAIDFLAND